MAQKARILALAAVAAAALFSASPSLAQDRPLQVASNDTRPTSAGDIQGNVNSFFGNVGKGIVVRGAYDPYDVVSRGVVPGKGPGYCLKGESLPHLEGAAANQVSLSLAPCSVLEQSGAFQRVAKAATSTPSAQGVNDAQGTAVDPTKVCTQLHVPVDNGTGDQYCMRKDGTVVGLIHYTRKTNGPGYDMAYEPLKQSVSIGVLKAGGGVASNGNVVLPANVQAGWDNVDAMKAQGLAKIQADQAARDAQLARNNATRKQAFKDKLGLD